MTSTLDRVRSALATPEPSAPPRWVLVASRTLLVIALIGAWCLVYLLGFSALQESRSQQALYTSFRSELAAGIAPVAEPIASGAPIGLITIPSIGMKDLVIVQGSDGATLENGPGHVPGTPLPGQNDISVNNVAVNSTIYGRATSFGGPFSRIPSLTRGDGIKIVTEQGTFTYAVLDVRHAGQQTPLSVPGTRGLLTLVTAKGSGALGWLSPRQAIYVDAVLQKGGQPSTAMTGLPRGRNDGPMASDLSFVIELELALTAIVVGAVIAGLVWSRGRWRNVQRWIVFVPLLMGSSWLFSDISVRLLPNLF